MGNTNSIQLLRRNEINEQKWQRLVDDAPNSLVYFHTWYLDRVSPGWAALVMEDYKYAMPLTLKKKMGIQYVSQPLYCQQLGIFPSPDTETTQLFLTELNQKISFVEINFNAALSFKEIAQNSSERHNYLLDLNSTYEDLANSYNQHTKRKLKKAAKKGLTLKTNISLKEYSEFKQANLNVRQSNNDLARLYSIIEYALKDNRAQIYGVYLRNGKPGAMAFFVQHKERITYLNAASSKDGKENQAMFYLIDQFIDNHSAKSLTLDFEGSMIPGVARLYKGFGAQPEMYFRYKMNNLPRWLKWIKR